MDQTQNNELVGREDSILPELPIESLEEFVSRLHHIPHKKEVAINKHADNSQYIPIAFIEAKLDKLFFGLWQIKNFQWTVVTNELAGSVDLGVFHPVARTWIWRSGAGAVLIRQKSGAEITDVGKKIKNALVQDLPHLKAQCMKNAASSLGPTFGRNLNRDFWEMFTPESEDQGLADHAKHQIDRVSNEAELNELLRSKPAWHKNESIYNLVIKKRQEFHKKAQRK